MGTQSQLSLKRCMLHYSVAYTMEMTKNLLCCIKGGIMELHQYVKLEAIFQGSIGKLVCATDETKL